MPDSSSSSALLGDAPPGGLGSPQTLREALWSLRQQQRRASPRKGPTETAPLIRTVVLDRPPPPRLGTPQQRAHLPKSKGVRQQPASKAQGDDEPPAAEPNFDEETPAPEPRSDDEGGEVGTADLHRLKRQRRSLEEEVGAVATAAASAKWRVPLRDLRAVYLHGLRKVGALQSLRDAPDAILPGNFPEPPLETRGPAS